MKAKYAWAVILIVGAAWYFWPTTTAPSPSVQQAQAVAQPEASSQSSVITAAQAMNYVGQIKTVCGTMVGGDYASSSHGSPTFLNLDQAYPNQIFTIVIWGENRGKFGAPESEYHGKQICVTGLIESYRGTAEIEVSDPSQITVSQ
jgi:micrococcal nuclease